MAVREGKLDVQKRTLSEIPIPDLQTRQDELIASLVHKYKEARKQWLDGVLAAEEAQETCGRLLRQIDAEVLVAYDLPPRTERALLDYFAGQPRPGPVAFKEYFPDWFKPYIPYGRYLSEEMERASAASTLGRIPVIDDALISDAMAAL